MTKENVVPSAKGTLATCSAIFFAVVTKTAYSISGAVGISSLPITLSMSSSYFKIKSTYLIETLSLFSPLDCGTYSLLQYQYHFWVG